MHHKQYLQPWLLLHHLTAICSSLCVWQAVTSVQAIQVIPGCGWCGATGERNLHDLWLILFTDRSCELVPHTSAREALKAKLLVQVISVLFIIKLPCAVTQSESKKEITHTHKTQKILTMHELLVWHDACKLARVPVLFRFNIKSRFSTRCGEADGLSKLFYLQA